MNRIQQLFQKKDKNILSIYFTAGFPTINSTIEIVEYLDATEVDMIEIGMPFSDPLADGLTIQQANTIALQNGMSIKLLLQQLQELRNKTQKPVLLMGYLNPILQYGETEFVQAIHEIGVDGLIIPDMPLPYYQKHLQPVYQKNNIAHVMLVTPTTSNERINEIDEQTTGFIYVVSSNSITGNQFNSNQQTDYFKRLQSLSLKNKTILGFGIHDKQSLTDAFQFANGAIIGSAFVKFISNNTISKKSISDYIQNLLP
jgi:tryptophan synthase alpha chain